MQKDGSLKLKVKLVLRLLWVRVAKCRYESVWSCAHWCWTIECYLFLKPFSKSFVFLGNTSRLDLWESWWFWGVFSTFQASQSDSSLLASTGTAIWSEIGQAEYLRRSDAQWAKISHLGMVNYMSFVNDSNWFMNKDEMNSLNWILFQYFHRMMTHICIPTSSLTR